MTEPTEPPPEWLTATKPEPDNFESDELEPDELELDDLGRDELGPDDLGSEELMDSFFGYDENQYGFVWLADLLGLGVLAAYFARVYGLVFSPANNFVGIDDDPSQLRLLAAAGDIFFSMDAGLLVLVAAALVVRFRPRADGVRSVLKLTSWAILAGAVASIAGVALSDTSVSLYDSRDLNSMLLVTSGAVAVQSAAALVTLNLERRSERVPTVAVTALLVTCVMGLTSGVFADSSPLLNASHNGGGAVSSTELAIDLSGAGSFPWLALVTAALLASVTGWAHMLRRRVAMVSVAAIGLAVAYLIVSMQADAFGDSFFPASAAFRAPVSIFAGIVSLGLAWMPFIRTEPGA